MTLLTVSALLEQPDLGLELKVAGPLRREIRWVHVSELIATESPFLRGGDVVLNDDRWMHLDDPRVFVESLIAADAAALGCGLRADGSDVGEALIEACRAAGLTLFTIPPSTPFVAVVERFVELVRLESEASLLATVDRCTRLVTALESSGSQIAVEVLSILRADLESDAWLIDHSGRVVSAAGNLRPEHAEPLTGCPPSQVPVAAQALGLEAVPVGATTARSWLLVTADRHTADGVIVQTLPFLASALARDLADLKADRRYASELIDLILNEQERLATVRLDTLLFDIGRPMVALAVSTPDDGDSLGRAFRAAERLGIHSMAAQDGDLITMIVQDRSQRKAAELAQQFYQTMEGTCVVGVGHPSNDIRGLRRSMVQASEAWALASSWLSGQTWATAESLSTHRVLLKLKDPEVLSAFASSLTAPLARHDRDRGTRLLETLRTYLHENGSLSRTSNAMHIHVNTLRQRLARCEQLTGRDLSRMEDRVDFFLAIASSEIVSLHRSVEAGHRRDQRPGLHPHSRRAQPSRSAP